jgi:hypothetical protein
VGVVQRRKEETIQELSSGWTVFLPSFGLVQQFGVFMLQEMAFQNITFLPLGGWVKMKFRNDVPKGKFN